MSLLKLILPALLFTFCIACDKGGDDLFDTPPITSTYLLNDSLVMEHNLANDSTVYTHYPFNKIISITVSGDKQTLWYNQDTFQYQYPDGYLRNGYLPMISLKNDSISFKYFGGGVGFQTWIFLNGVKQ